MAFKKEYEQTVWIFEYFISRSFGQWSDGTYLNPSVCLSLGYDEGLDLCADWGEDFPGNKPDPNYIHAQVRLRKFLNKLVDDGWLDKRIRGNQLEYAGEAGTWSYAYSLKQWLLQDIKSGKTTVEEQAARYTGRNL